MLLQSSVQSICSMKEDWKYSKLGEICDLYQPKTISGDMLLEDGEYLVYGANGIIGRYDKYNHVESEVLLTCRGATCGSINISEPYSWINGNAMVVHPSNEKELRKDFIRYYLASVDWSKVITGAAQPQITRQSLSPLQVACPPLPEQKRIVAELDCLFKMQVGLTPALRVKLHLNSTTLIVVQSNLKQVEELVSLFLQKWMKLLLIHITESIKVSVEQQVQEFLWIRKLSNRIPAFLRCSSGSFKG